MSYTFLATSDLIFQSKLTSMSTALKLPTTKPGTLEDTLKEIKSTPPALIVVDLRLRKFDPIELVRRSRSECGFNGPIICFGPHLEEALLAAAKDAGATAVVPNSVMSARGLRLMAELTGRAIPQE